MTLSIADDSRITNDPHCNVDYLSNYWEHGELWATRRFICSKKRETKHSQRLENALWRAWAKQAQHLPNLPSQSLQWYIIEALPTQIE